MRTVGAAALLVLAWPATAQAVDYGGGRRRRVPSARTAT